ncbi:MAG: Ig-like domain-containing protein, partial [Flavobacteriaceae bacterium]|nr:Ig-like domain-containing protein [Flavobacteriaceae bacterium]
IVMTGATAVTGTVTYAGTTASFTPASPLLPNTVYTGRVTILAKDVSGNALQEDYVWTFTTSTIPAVVSTDPVNLTTGVVLNKVITANFSEAMNASTITAASTFTLNQGTTIITGTVTYSGLIARFTPASPLTPNTVYTATITTAAKNLAGNSIANNYVWTFTTSTIPTIIATDPLNLATGVALNKVISATFSEAMTATSITAASTFTLRQGTTNIPGTVTYSGLIASFTPSSPLLSGTTYTATITTAAKNLAGNSIASDYVWTFTTNTIPTVVSTDPLNLATGVALNKVISATFSEAMTAATITATAPSTFTLKQGTTTITGSVLYSGLIATFTPSSPLISNTVYTATITTAAKNLAGNSLANDYVWTFTTVASSGPVGVDLKTAGQFGILGGTAISNNAGFSEIRNMDVGLYPGARSSITGFPPAIVVNGAIFAADDLAPPGVPAMLLQAKTDLTNAYLFAEGATSPAPATVSGDQGGKTLAPGIYKSTSTLLIQSGNLTLDAQGDVNAVWIFQVASDFTTVGGAGGSIILAGGAKAKNVFWQVGSSATIGDYTSFKGNILALTSITMNAYATAEGRMLARNGAVTMTSTNIINKPLD